MPTLADIVGQDAAVKWLRQGLARGRLPHGMAFIGPEGVGKATTAAAVARDFLCETPRDDGSACGQCRSCRVFDAGAHPDYHIVTRELFRLHDKTGTSKGVALSVNVIRPEVVARASMKSTLGRGRVFVIEQSERMNAPAQNALLKTLEEPPGRALLILLCNDEAGLLPTIRSRCQAVRFGRLPGDWIQQQLVARQVSADQARVATTLAEGSLGVALRWIEDGVIAPATALTGAVDAVFAGRGAGGITDLLKSAADGYAAGQLARDPLGSKDQATREGLELFISLAAGELRRRIERSAGDADSAAIERACSAIDVMRSAEENIHANVNVTLVLQQIAVGLERAAGMPSKA